MTLHQHPEQIARNSIDRMLREAGWDVQNNREIDLYAALGVAVREYQTDVGPADYALFVVGNACGILEAKHVDWGQNLTTVETECTFRGIRPPISTTCDQ